MNILKSISDPAVDERVVGVSPTLATNVPSSSQRRLNLFAGRALTDTALTSEQNHRSRAMSLAAQRLTPGTVSGLDVGLEGGFLHVSAGRGLTASGEDVTVRRAIRVELTSLLAYTAGVSGGPELSSPEQQLRSLGELQEELQPLPGIVVLKPVVLEKKPANPSTNPSPSAEWKVPGTHRAIGDQCTDDPSAHAFEDWRLVDAVQVVIYLWPTSLPAFGSVALAENAETLRNRLAWAIFEAERQLAADETLPWQDVGVPIGLVGFGDEWEPRFLDQHSVARRGGDLSARTKLVADSLTPTLLHAQLAQFSEQLISQPFENWSQLRSTFTHIPAAGLLPRAIAELGLPPEAPTDASSPNSQAFFPENFDVDFAPIPMEQLDTAMRRSASLARLDLSKNESVRLLVPVPQTVYEPDLLKRERISGEFQLRINAYASQRDEELRRRKVVRDIVSTLHAAMKGEDAVVTFPSDDPSAVMEDEQPIAELPDNEEQQLRQRFAVTASGDELRSDRLENLIADLKSRTPLKASGGSAPLAEAPGAIPSELESKLSWSSGVLRWRGSIETVERAALDQFISDSSENAELQTALQIVRKQTQADELSQLTKLGITGFIDKLQRMVDDANDKVNLGFTRTRTDIYRVRQLMLNTTDASRLATSPVLAEIAKGETALSTKDDVSAYVAKLQNPKSVARKSPMSPEDATFRRAKTPERPFVLFDPISADTSFVIDQPIREGFLRDDNLGFRGRDELIGDVDLSTNRRDSISLIDQSKTSVSTPILASQEFGTFTFAKQKDYSEIDVLHQAYLPGKPELFRTTTIAERLANPQSIEAKNAAVSTMYDAVKGLAASEMYLGDVAVSGIAEFGADGQPITIPPDTEGAKVFKRRTFSLSHLQIEMGGRQLTERILLDPSPENGDEADFFSATIDLLENTAALYRRVEARIGGYQLAIELCNAALREITSTVASANKKLVEVGHELAEARHDVTVATSLMEEEQARLDQINTRRELVLKEHVRFLAYQRPRIADVTKPLPVRALDPGLTDDPVPNCVGNVQMIPSELEEMIEVFHEAPVAWFPNLAQFVAKLDHPDSMIRLIEKSGNRARFRQQFPKRKLAISGLLGRPLTSILESQSRLISKHRVAALELNYGLLRKDSWQNLYGKAKKVVTVGSLIESADNGNEISETVAKQVKKMMGVANCLYEKFGNVSPAIRLDWADDLSQFDSPPNLHRLSVLDRWSRVPSLERRVLQELVDFLFRQIDQGEPEAVALMNDTVRVCILLASHAPVNEIITGRIEGLADDEETTVVNDKPVTLRIDPKRVRIGMQVLVRHPVSKSFVRGTVEDLVGSQARARFRLPQGPMRVTGKTRFQFALQSSMLGQLR